MSQAGILNTSSGPVPPAVITQFTADDATIAIPVGNNINLLSRDTTEDNPNGIQTTADPNGSDNLYIELTNRIRITATTSDGGGQTQTVNLLTPPTASASTFIISITGYDAINNELTGGELIGLVRRSGGGATVVLGSNDTFEDSDPALNTTDWDLISDGTQTQFQFVGVAGRTINWSAVVIYDQVQ